MKTVTLIPGDGIGPEIIESVKKVFEAANVQIKWEERLAGEYAYEICGELLPEDTLDSIKRNKIALKAPLTTPVGKGFRSVNVQIRKELDLYANVRPIRTIEGVNSPLKSKEKIDMVIVRENTEGLYAGVEHMVGDDAAETIRIITRKASERVGKFAVSLMAKRNSPEEKFGLTIVHKANILKFTDGLFMNSIKDYARKKGWTVPINDVIIDNMCMQLVQRPETFDVIVCPNLHGDIISDLCAALVGGLGVAPGANIGDECAVYEAIHGTAPDIAGKGIANPTSLLLSAVMMLRDPNIKDYENADKIENAIFKTIKEGKHLTGDLGGSANTEQYTNAIISNL
jgi:isocitrate dehydrogenase (NAD+)